VDDPATPADEANDRMQDFAYFQTLGSIGDTIWSDVDDDGNAIIDGEDFPIEGVTVKLLDASGAVIATDVTDADGKYLFEQLPLNATYTVQVDTTTLPDVKQTNPAYDPDGGDDNQSTVTLTVDDPATPADEANNRMQDFAYFQTLGSIGDTIWSDVDDDGNAIIDGEDFPIEGVTVKLLDASGAVIATDVTDADGKYLFEQLPLNATYTVQVDTTTLPDVKQTNPAYDPDGGDDNQSTVTLTVDDPATPADEANNRMQDFAYFQTLGSIGDTIWSDVDADGNAVIDGEDFPIEGVVVNLLDSSGAVIATDTTDENGQYLFDQLPLNATYTVQIDTTTLPNVKQGNPAYDPDGDGDNQSTVTLTVDDPATPGDEANDLNRDFAYFQTVGTIGDTIWSDVDNDGNGLIDGEDFPIEGVVVNLLDSSGAVIATETTDENGQYLFAQLLLNETYTVQVDTTTLPDVKEGNPGYDPDGVADNQSTVILTVDAPNDRNQDFAYFQKLGAIGDTIWSDMDADGNAEVDGDDFPIEGVVVNLLDSSGAVIATETTDEDGKYLFDQLPLNETYTVQVDTTTLPDVKQGNPGYDPDGVADNQSTVTLTVEEQFNFDQDFAYFQTLGSIGDTLWSDPDADGNDMMDGDDFPIEGVIVKLLDSNGGVITTETTDENGQYLFEQLPLNEMYTVQIDTTTLPDVKQTNPAYDPDGGSDSQSSVMLTVDAPDNTDQDFAYFQTLGSIGNILWSDPDNDGNDMIDGDDFPIEGVTVKLIDNSGRMIATDVTDENGQYMFEQLPLNATYTIQIDTTTLPDIKQTNPAYDPDGGSDSQSSVTLTVDAPDNAQQNFAYFQSLGSIGDTLWSDPDNDGNNMMDGDDFPIEGAVVNLLDSDGAIIATETTNANGQYSFDQLPLNATYTVQIDTTTLPEIKQGNPSYDPDGGGDNQSTVTLTPEDRNNQDQDFGYFEDIPPAPLGTIGDTIWHDNDQDGNGMLDGDDEAIEGVVVNLLDSSGAVIATDTTDENGTYLFTDLPLEQTYTVQIDTTTLPAEKQDNPIYDPDGGNDNQSTVTLTADAPNNRAQDFAYYAPSDPPPAAGPAIELQKTVYAGHNGGAGCPGGEIESGGNSPITYCFEVMNSGNTYLSEIQVNDPDIGITRADMKLLSGTEPLAPGASMTFYYETVIESELVNTANVLGNPTDAAGVDLPGLADPTDSDIAQVKVAAGLGDYVWLDRNANGVQDSGEPGLEDVVVYLLDAESNVLETTTTDANGFYLFTDLEPGDYAIRVELPAAGYQFTTSDQLDDAFDSDVNTETGISPLTTLDPSENDRTMDVGIVALPSLNVEKQATTSAVQPGGIVVYAITYSNTGVGDSTGVKLTEVVPRDTRYVVDGSSEGWVCEGGAVEAGTICSFNIGALPAGSKSTEDILFVVRAENSIDSNTKTIDNQVLINDDGLAGPSASGQSVDSAIIEIQRPTALEAEFEPGTSGGNDRVFLPFVGRNQFKSNGEAIELTVDQMFMSWVCSFLNNFGWTSDACFISIE